jgi:hypothetical protein
MKILIIGDSHVASLKQGWENIKSDFPACNVSFVAARGRNVKHFKLKQGVLFSEVPHVTKSIEATFGKSEVNLIQLDPDVVLFYGMGLTFPNSFLQSCSKLQYSINFIEQCLTDMFSQYGYQLVKMICEHIQKNVFISAPFVAFPPTKKVSGTNNDSEVHILDILAFANNSVFQKFNVEYVLQPVETFDVELLRTYPSYTSGSQRLLVDSDAEVELHPLDDIDHMNREFGSCFLRAFMIRALDKRNGK